MNGCRVSLSWNAPNNILPDDITLYRNYLDEDNHMNTTPRTDTSLSMTSFVVCDCAVHNVSVSTVNRCGVDGQRSPSITIEPESESNSMLSMCPMASTAPTEPSQSNEIECTCKCFKILYTRF